MKKINFMLIPIVVISIISLLGCKKDPKPKQVINLESLEVNFYKPASTGEETDVPQLTFKNSEIQLTAIGNNSNGVQQSINKIYISDKQSKTEWIALLDNSKPAFFYAINSSTKEKMPDLYWIEYKDATTSVLRYYEYDWVNRLGTLIYEAEIANDIVNVVYKNEVREYGRINNVRGSSTNGKAKISKSFPTPIPVFNKLNDTHSEKNQIRSGESMDEQFDKGIADFMSALKDLKFRGINASCTANKFLNRPQKNIICLLSDQLDKIVNERLFGDLTKAGETDQGEAGSEYESITTKFDIDFFNAADISDNIRRHINDFRGDLSASVNFSEWVSNLREYTRTRIEDLNDLSDKNGVIHVGLSWNTTSDIDLHVTDPFGEKIYFDHPTSNSAGYLDRDDVDGFGPENIYWMGNGPDGTYKIEVHYFSPATSPPPTQYTIKVINGLGFSKIYQGTLSGWNKFQTVVVFAKNGSSITVQ